jgi:hypothetical protein
LIVDRLPMAPDHAGLMVGGDKNALASVR